MKSKPVNRKGAASARQKKESQVRDVWRRLLKNKLAVFSLCVIIVMLIVVIFADWIAPYSASEQDLSNAFTYPCFAHPLGTDNYGRDILSRIIYGGRISLFVAFVAVMLASVVGGLLGAVAAYIGGAMETVIMRFMDILMSIPAFLLAISISASLGTGIFNTAIAIGLGSVPQFARVIRGSILTIRGQEYIEAARACGGNSMHIIFRHLIPNSLAPMIVQATLGIGTAIFAISSLSFIGLGVQPPTPEWGSMLADARNYITQFWPVVTFPGVAIVITLLSFNLLGDGLRDALDPRLKQ